MYNISASKMYRKLEGANLVGALLSYSTWRRRWKESFLFAKSRLFLSRLKWQLWKLGHFGTSKG